LKKLDLPSPTPADFLLAALVVGALVYFAFFKHWIPA